MDSEYAKLCNFSESLVNEQSIYRNTSSSRSSLLQKNEERGLSVCEIKFKNRN